MKKIYKDELKRTKNEALVINTKYSLNRTTSLALSSIILIIPPLIVGHFGYKYCTDYEYYYKKMSKNNIGIERELELVDTNTEPYYKVYRDIFEKDDSYVRTFDMYYSDDNGELLDSKEKIDNNFDKPDDNGYEVINSYNDKEYAEYISYEITNIVSDRNTNWEKFIATESIGLFASSIFYIILHEETDVYKKIDKYFGSYKDKDVNEVKEKVKRLKKKKE